MNENREWAITVEALLDHIKQYGPRMLVYAEEGRIVFIEDEGLTEIAELKTPTPNRDNTG